MSMGKIALLFACFSLLAMAASATSRKDIQIKVLDSQTQSLGLGNNAVAMNCDQVTFDAYCRSSNTARQMNTLLVQEGNNPPFRISCTAESKLSKCVHLPAGENYEARKEKKGVTVYYTDDKGKLRSQLYTLVAEETGGAAKAAAPAATGAPAAAQPSAGSNAAAATGNTAQPAAQTSGLSEAVESSTLPQTVKCSFTSTPAGAEVTVDGRYVGSTPSVLGLTTGPHVVVISTAGFAPWKRDLMVEPGSELTVNAVLQKAQ